MNNQEIKYKMAFSFLKKRITAEMIRDFGNKGVSPEDFFRLPTKELVARLGLRPEPEFDKNSREEALMAASKELDLITRHNIRALFLLDDSYPQNLAETYDPPLILYKLGDAPLEGEHFMSVVGTRKPSPYGVECCNTLIEDIGDYFNDAVIISGLAYGIDSTAHKKALEKGLKTIAVVAHGLNMIYPAANRNLAKDIIRAGGAIISEYPFGVKPFKPNFLARNRIVAGLADATVVVESKIKGGAMSTANFAFVNNRDVLAFPGRKSDELSSGCNLLIRKNKAHLIESAADLIEITGWEPMGLSMNPGQRNLFPELDGEAKIIYDILKSRQEPIQTDQLVHLSGIPVAKVMAITNELEFDGIIIRYPGNRFAIN